MPKLRRFTKEELKEIEKRYIIYADGRVYNIKKDFFLKQHTTRDGYKGVRLFTDKFTHNFMVHRLVGIKFVKGKTTAKEYINHKNGIKNDNNAKNLEWVTHKDNIIHSRRELKNKSGSEEKKLRNMMVVDLFGKYKSHEIALVFGISTERALYIKNREKRNV